MSIAIKSAGLVIGRVRKLYLSFDLSDLRALFKKHLSLQCQGQVLLASLAFISVSHAAPAADWAIEEDTELTEYHDKKEAAQKLMKDVQHEVEAALPVLRNYWKNGLSPQVPAQSRRFAALVQRGDQLSEPFRPFGPCRGAAIMADQIWTQHIASRELQADKLYFAWQNYSDTLRYCQHSIDVPPDETFTLIGPKERAHEVPKACLSVSDTSWSCPASARQTVETMIAK